MNLQGAAPDSKMDPRASVSLLPDDITLCFSPRRMHLILLPTEACNFRCHYCYETFQLRRMAPDVVQGTERWIERLAARLDTLVLSWFGGEPLLARDLIERILRRVEELRESFPFRLESDITTNAYMLTLPVFERLLELGITSYQISLDGPKAYHDSVRVLAGGRGTFDRIWSHLVAIRSARGSFRVLVRIHVNRENAGLLPGFIDRYAERFGDDARYELFLRPLSRLGGPRDDELPILEGDEAETAVGTLREHARARGLRLGPAESGIPICYAAMSNSFVVRADGRLNKCTVALEHPRNQVGRLLPDGRVRVDSPSVLAWMRGFRSGSPTELECPMEGLADRAEPRSPTTIPLVLQGGVP